MAPREAGYYRSVAVFGKRSAGLRPAEEERGACYYSVGDGVPVCAAAIPDPASSAAKFTLK